ncbi:MAG: dienelactone hydrolase family protein [Propionibacteriaceae bacterium]|nr:dienelactone hydrolase family protein [Propionibacteriaceae bacterium]
MNQIDTSAVLWREGTGDELVIALHGFGADERDLFGVAQYLPRELTVAAVRGPAASPFGGYAWFEFNPAVDSTDHTMIDRSAGLVLGWLDALERDYSRVHVFGFSQGGALAVQLTRLEPTRFASVCHLSSFVHNGDLPRDAELAERKLPLFQGIGHDDDVIATDKRERSIPWLDQHFDVERHYYPRGHTIAVEELNDVAAFLSRV